MKRLLEILNRKAEIRKDLENADTKALEAFKAELEQLNTEEEELRKKQELAQQLLKETKVPEAKKETRKNMEINSKEYRSAFMNYVIKGEATQEFRDAAFTNTADNSAVIPQPLLDEIVTKLEKESDILKRVKRMAYPAGFVVPTSAMAFTATWQAEGTPLDSQKATSAKITFSAYELRCAAGVTFQMDVKGLASFEKLIVDTIFKAMKKALEKAVVNGTGSGQPKGLAVEAAPTSKDVKTLDYATLMGMLKAIPGAYKADSVLIMNEDTVLDILAITDKSGQPVARVTEGLQGAPAYKLFGKEIVLTDELKGFTEAGDSEIFAMAFDLNKYVLNTGYDMDLVTYTDNATRNKVYDSVMLVDGKAVDIAGLVHYKKKA